MKDKNIPPSGISVPGRIAIPLPLADQKKGKKKCCKKYKKGKRCKKCPKR